MVKVAWVWRQSEDFKKIWSLLFKWNLSPPTSIGQAWLRCFQQEEGDSAFFSPPHSFVGSINSVF